MMRAKVKLSLLIIIWIIFLSSFSLADTFRPEIDIGVGLIPKEGFVPDEGTALLIAHAVLIKIYGEKVIESEQPFKAVLKNEVWIVEGSLPEDMAGGVATIRISKKDGCILYVYHDK